MARRSGREVATAVAIEVTERRHRHAQSPLIRSPEDAQQQRATRAREDSEVAASSQLRRVAIGGSDDEVTEAVVVRVETTVDRPSEAIVGGDSLERVQGRPTRPGEHTRQSGAHAGPVQAKRRAYDDVPYPIVAGDREAPAELVGGAVARALEQHRSRLAGDHLHELVVGLAEVSAPGEPMTRSS